MSPSSNKYIVSYSCPVCRGVLPLLATPEHSGSANSDITKSTPTQLTYCLFIATPEHSGSANSDITKSTPTQLT